MYFTCFVASFLNIRSFVPLLKHPVESKLNFVDQKQGSEN
jgi:hypothetical protein